MEFRKMRRFRQQLTQSECEAILSNATSGTLALLGDPYAVPISYVYADDAGLQKELEKGLPHMLILRLESPYSVVLSIE